MIVIDKSIYLLGYQNNYLDEKWKCLSKYNVLFRKGKKGYGSSSWMVLVSVVHNRKKVVWLEKNGRFSYNRQALYFDRRPPYMCAALVVPAQKESKHPESHPEARFRSKDFLFGKLAWRGNDFSFYMCSGNKKSGFYNHIKAAACGSLNDG